jgi:hypothetical protein
MIPYLALLLLFSQVPERSKMTRDEEAVLVEKNHGISPNRVPMNRDSPVPIAIEVSFHSSSPMLERFSAFSHHETYKRGMDPEQYIIELLPVNASLPNIRVKAQRPIAYLDGQPGPTPWLLGDLPPNLPPCRGFKVFDPKGVFIGQRILEVDKDLPPILVEVAEDGWIRVTGRETISELNLRISLDDGLTWTQYGNPGGVFQEYFQGGFSALKKPPLLEFLVIKDLRYERRRIRLDGIKAAVVSTSGVKRLE